MTFFAFLQILGMALVAALGGVLIFQVLHWIETRHKTPKEHHAASSQPVENKQGAGAAMPV